MLYKRLLCNGAAFACCLLVAVCAHADTVQYGGLTFTLVNSGYLVGDVTDGSAAVSGSDLVIYGPDNGSGEPGTTDLVTTAPSSGTVSFDWSFSGLNSLPGEYTAGYLANGVFDQLADTDGQSGAAQFAVMAGESFGFEVNSDNQGIGPVFTISAFSAPGATAVPEPASNSLVAVAAALLLLSAGSRLLRRRVFDFRRYQTE